MNICHCALVALFIFKPAVTSQTMNLFQQISYILEVTRNLEDIYKFDNLIMYRIRAPLRYNSLKLPLNEGLNYYEHDIVKHFARFFTQHALTPKMIFTIEPSSHKNDTATIPNLGNILTNKNLAVVLLEDILNKELKEFVAKSLGASLETKIVFISISDELTEIKPSIRLDKMWRFFHWCWAKNILNAILIFQKYNFANISDFTMEIYTYTPFPKPIKLICLTSVDASQYFTQKTSDLQGYEFKTPVLSNKPSVFKVTDPKTGKQIITGTVGHLYLEFVRQFNGTFVEVPSDHVDYTKSRARLNYVSNLLEEGLIDVGINPFSFLTKNHYSGSYPITHSNSCVVVPVVPEINRAFYILYSFNTTIWQYLLLTFVLFSILHMIMSYQRNNSVSPDIAFAVTLTGMLNIPSGYEQNYINNGRIIQRFIQILLIITGLIFSHLYVTTLTSLLSTTMYGEQLETAKDLQVANITLMTLDYQYHLYTQLNILPKELNFVLRDGETISQHQASLNTSYGYIVFQEEWNVMRRLQSNLWKPVFKIASKLCIPNIYHAMPMQLNSPFYEPLKEFTLQSQASGLRAIWSDIVFSDIQRNSMTKRFVENEEHPASITLEHLILLWFIWTGGILLASGTFCVEFYMMKNSLA